MNKLEQTAIRQDVGSFGQIIGSIGHYQVRYRSIEFGIGLADQVSYPILRYWIRQSNIQLFDLTSDYRMWYWAIASDIGDIEQTGKLCYS